MYVHMIPGIGASAGWGSQNDNVLLTARLICLVPQLHKSPNERGNSVLRNVPGSGEAVGGKIFEGYDRLSKGETDKDGIGHRGQRLDLTSPQVEKSV